MNVLSFTYRILTLLIFTGCFNGINAQLYIENADLTTLSDAVVFVNGDVQYAGSKEQSVLHDGLLELKGNWYNTAVKDKKVFADASAGNVLFSGALQTFNGFNTRFPNLTLTGTDKKQQFAPVEVRHVLDLTDRELDVNSNTATLLSDDLAAVKYVSGYVNTTAGNHGWLVRNMHHGSSYVFPLGDRNGSLFRFRPMVISAAKDGNIFGQFQDYNPSKDGFPASQKMPDIQVVNENWYHAVTTDAADGNSVNVLVTESSIADGGVYSKMVTWNNSKRMWENLPSTGAIPSLDYNTNDYIFKTSAAIAINNQLPVDINLAMEHHDEFYIPNVITPNGDGKNDTWKIKGLDLTAQNEVVIFNRWNNIVYETKNYTNTWDGKGLNAGTYFYILKIKKDGNEKVYKGFIMLMR
ncbi:gliding motility-associated C-terminal domain-containing protein [Danxiaibacter flavus]|uniref:Gliding motility-associated C-terminal domain-containing protein n=1 Tax=Danxiaibacter flavus TaxID=3049108 RepID=A0ABV3ZPH6_9BACT|nr:gliding motility-associated C-terminal domain-containing protein [Chitinophagaceae bacterium DXS]